LIKQEKKLKAGATINKIDNEQITANTVGLSFEQKTGKLILISGVDANGCSVSRIGEADFI
jgi:hypothetical protein